MARPKREVFKVGAKVWVKKEDTTCTDCLLKESVDMYYKQRTKDVKYLYFSPKGERRSFNRCNPCLLALEQKRRKGLTNLRGEEECILKAIPKQYNCKRCNDKTINRYYCGTCHDILATREWYNGGLDDIYEVVV
jgi:hypothetical protein